MRRRMLMMFTKYIVVVDDDVDVHNTSEVLFRLCANTDPQRDSIFTKVNQSVTAPRHVLRISIVRTGRSGE